uniref:Protein kinase domain-containing protein n=1 Tax=Eptatretus burgeri TaxID=7764 RepID=A0A8C4NML7_EPTBU
MPAEAFEAFIFWMQPGSGPVCSVCSAPTVHAKAQESCLSEHQLWAFLQKNQLPEDGRQPWLQLLARFEIALPLQDGRYLLPHLLPEKPSSTLSPEPTSPTRAHTLLRHVQMSFVPMGFWQRLIARLLISLSSMEHTGLTSVWNRLQVTSTLDRDKQDAAGTRALYRHGSTFCVRQARKTYWQEGLCACYANGFLSVEALGRRSMQTTNHSGIAIMVQSQSQDLSAVAFVMDHVTSLIEQWFPALLGTEPDGTPFVRQLIPCSRCLLTPSPSTQTQLDPSLAILNAPEQLPHMFRLEECLLRAVTDDRMLCPKHPDRPVPLPQLVPEIFMTDFPRRYFLECSKLTIIDGDAGYLGHGGSGTTIRRAQYQGTVVAVKIFTILSCNEDDDMLRDLYANRIARVFAEFRLEARMLQSLRHPCIPALLGIMLYPLCLALELAPHGSLRLVLDAAELVPVPLGPLLSYKVAHQVALALAYLHRKDIIFCDLKSDNVLMWSLDPNETVNAKLSDYGISRLSFGQGARGTEGTPGYQAPEVCPGIIYDEKVDMFSYGMLLFELLSGQRPTLQGKPMEVLRKLNCGLRPRFPRPVHTTCKTLALLATRCWQTAPEQVLTMHHHL